MSINELTTNQYKQHTFNQAYSDDVIKGIKTASDIKNNTDALTFKENVKNSSHGTYALFNRQRNSDLEVDFYYNLDVNSADYYEGL
jgi:hypothetical protein